MPALALERLPQQRAVLLGGGGWAPPAYSAPIGSLSPTLDATFLEKDRTDEEVDSGVHSVWFLDLEPADLPRERRLGDVQALGGAAEVQLLGDRDEVAQLPQGRFH